MSDRLKSGTMALDASTRNLGFAVDVIGRTMPMYGLYTLPGISDRGLLYQRVVDTMEELVVKYNPERFIFATAFYDKVQTAARALNGVQAMIEFVAANCNILVIECIENIARKRVLGHVNFGKRDERTGKLIPGSGRKGAKNAVMAWADRRGYNPTSDDVADALVLLEYDRLVRTTNLAPG